MGPARSLSKSARERKACGTDESTVPKLRSARRCYACCTAIQGPVPNPKPLLSSAFPNQVGMGRVEPSVTGKWAVGGRGGPVSRRNGKLHGKDNEGSFDRTIYHIMFNFQVERKPGKMHEEGTFSSWKLASSRIVPSTDTCVTLATRIGMMPMLLVFLDVWLAKFRKLLMGEC
mmetsp:Transcript_3775/g.23811  ORF Transcript_3775/g.23811 Transcript_3775/m.23811 type:complete len:173 (-) Transcript_3775:1660-2178(-)